MKRDASSLSPAMRDEISLILKSAFAMNSEKKRIGKELYSTEDKVDSLYIIANRLLGKATFDNATNYQIQVANSFDEIEKNIIALNLQIGTFIDSMSVFDKQSAVMLEKIIHEVNEEKQYELLKEINKLKDKAVSEQDKSTELYNLFKQKVDAFENILKREIN